MLNTFVGWASVAATSNECPAARFVTKTESPADVDDADDAGIDNAGATSFDGDECPPGESATASQAQPSVAQHATANKLRFD